MEVKNYKKQPLKYLFSGNLKEEDILKIFTSFSIIYDFIKYEVWSFYSLQKIPSIIFIRVAAIVVNFFSLVNIISFIKRFQKL